MSRSSKKAKSSPRHKQNDIVIREGRRIQMLKSGHFFRNSQALPLIFICLVYIVVFVVGRFLLAAEAFRHGTIHQLVLTTISLIQIYMLIYLRRIIQTLTGITNGYNVHIYQSLTKLQKRLKSVINYLWPIFPAILFARKQLAMGYVPLSATGIYAITFAASTFYMGLICYSQSLLTMLAVRDITKIAIVNLPFDFPDDTLRPPEWLVTLYSLFRKGQYAFFSVGILYTLEYVLLMPENIISFGNSLASISINVTNRIGFLTGWLVIIVLIIIAFPIYMSYFTSLFRKLVSNLKSKATGEMKVLFSNSAGTKLDSFHTMFNLSNEIMKDENYLFKSKTVYPIVATAISIAINLFKLAELVWPRISLLFP